MIEKRILKAIFCGRENVLINKENNTEKNIAFSEKKKNVVQESN